MGLVLYYLIQQKISPSEQGELPLPPELSTAAKKATILPQLKSTSLVSVGLLFDDNKRVIYDKQRMRAIQHTQPLEQFLKRHKTLLEGKQNHLDEFWDITLPVLNSVIIQPQISGFTNSTHHHNKINTPPPREFQFPIAQVIKQYNDPFVSDGNI